MNSHRINGLCAALAVVFALGSLAIGVSAGGAFPRAEAEPGPPARLRVASEYPRGAGGEIRIGDSLVVNGQPMQLSVFYTADPPARVIEFYIPTRFYKQVKWIPLPQRGKVVEFRPAISKSA